MVKHSSRIFLSQSALKQNFRFIREKIGPHAVISSVVKANAFGHGIGTFVPMAMLSRYTRKIGRVFKVEFHHK